MRDNRDPQLVGEQLLSLRKQHKKKKLSQVQDIASRTGIAIGYTPEELHSILNDPEHRNGHA